MYMRSGYTALHGNPLSAQAELGDEIPVALDILPTEVVEQTSALANHQQQTASAVVVVLVLAKMLGQMVYPLGEHRHLNLWRTSVALVCAELGDDFSSCLHCAWNLK